MQTPNAVPVTLSQIRAGDRLVTGPTTDVLVREWTVRLNGSVQAVVDGDLTGSGITVTGRDGTELACCRLRVPPLTVLRAQPTRCTRLGHLVSPYGPDDIQLRIRSRSGPAVVWFGEHPTVLAPELGRGRENRRYQCVRCGARDGFSALRCRDGLIVHLPEPGRVGDPAGALWSDPDSVARARTWWADRGYVVTPVPAADPNLAHSLYRVCGPCNEAILEF